MTGRSVTSWLKLLLLGAASFWIPDVIVHGLTRFSFSSIYALLLTIVLPVCFTWAYILAGRRYNNVLGSVAVPMLIGLWTLGGLFMNIGLSFSGGGFATHESLRQHIVNIMLSFLPPYTFMMATYDGTLFALLLATVAPVFARMALKSKAMESDYEVRGRH